MIEFSKKDFPVRYGPAMLKIDTGFGTDWMNSIAYSCNIACPSESNDKRFIAFSPSLFEECISLNIIHSKLIAFSLLFWQKMKKIFI